MCSAPTRQEEEGKISASLAGTDEVTELRPGLGSRAATAVGVRGVSTLERSNGAQLCVKWYEKQPVTSR